ncbi:MAG: hypothetical protein VX733_13105 [Candidatus Latescibacterota bacterium]|nr:hypothetical protein [Candidatus Latescibacterota bacterium]
MSDTSYSPCFTAIHATWVLLVVGALCSCGGEESAQLERRHDYMDSLRVYLGDLRLLDYQIGEAVQEDTIASHRIVPLIIETLRPTLENLRKRSLSLQRPEGTEEVHELLIHYLDLRIEAYDDAIRGEAEGKPGLFKRFSQKQIEADGLGRKLEDELHELRGRTPGYY